MGPQSDFNFAPREQDIRVMPLLLGHASDSIDKIQGLLEIRKGECTSDVMLVHYLPVRPFGELSVQVSKLFSFERRHSPTAWHTSFAGKFRHKLLRSTLCDG